MISPVKTTEHVSIITVHIHVIVSTAGGTKPVEMILMSV